MNGFLWISPDDPLNPPIALLKNKKNREFENMQTNQTAPSPIFTKSHCSSQELGCNWIPHYNIYLTYTPTNIYLYRSLISDSDDSASDTDSEDDALSPLAHAALDSPTLDKGVGLLMQLFLDLAECCMIHQ